ncbi:hypothetical protein [Lederbergia graminis]|uniref:Uncharacterized protein n=1 Tax=Lederbergia graminis TaxID=735518 RepID=A0ABW0LMU5_9BACI|nr:hypothetical protein [Paenibacillus bovis]HLU23614.1 hypothetical protein [Bacillaceae bacterium]
MTKKSQIAVFGVATLVMLANILYKMFAEKEVDFYEMIALGVFSTFLLQAITWGTRKENNGILQDEELGQKIVEQSSKISYTVVYFLLLAAILTDKLVNGTSNIFLLATFILAMITFPIVQFMVSRRYQ